MKVKALREVFNVAAKHCREDGKVVEAEALSAFAANLLRDDRGTVASFVKRVEKAREQGRTAGGQVSRRARGRNRRRGN
jgi:hypothetical protein